MPKYQIPDLKPIKMWQNLIEEMQDKINTYLKAHRLERYIAKNTYITKRKSQIRMIFYIKCARRQAAIFVFAVDDITVMVQCWQW